MTLVIVNHLFYLILEYSVKNHTSKYLLYVINIQNGLICFVFFRNSCNSKELSDRHLRSILMKRIDGDSYEYATVQSLI